MRRTMLIVSLPKGADRLKVL